MKYLLDTHAVLWCFNFQGNRLSEKARELIIDPENEIYVSSASLWEVAIKVSLGKLDLSFDKLLVELKKSGFQIIQIESSYLRKLLDLPQIHKDPFDRLIITTAQTEKMTVVTADENVHKYDVKWVW